MLLLKKIIVRYKRIKAMVAKNFLLIKCPTFRWTIPSSGRKEQVQTGLWNKIGMQGMVFTSHEAKIAEVK